MRARLARAVPYTFSRQANLRDCAPDTSLLFGTHHRPPEGLIVTRVFLTMRYVSSFPQTRDGDHSHSGIYEAATAGKSLPAPGAGYLTIA